MCTILAALAVWPGAPLVIAANRDERLGRPAEGPGLHPRGTLCDRSVVAPRDLQAGGTWLGLADTGLFVGITNRRSPPDAQRRSRGELVLRALEVGERAAALARIAALSAADYNPFHLLLADRSGADVLWSDGERLHRVALEPGIHWVTERSFGAAPSRRHARLARWAAQASAGREPSVADWRALLAEHDERGPAPPPATAIELDAMCVHADPLDYGTRSSTLLRFGEQPGDVGLLHAPGKPCVTELVDCSSLVRELLSGG